MFEQRVLALANGSVHSSSCSPVSFPRRHVSLSTDPGAAIPFHLSSCMFNPLLSVPPHLSLCRLCLSLFVLFPSRLAADLIPLPLLHSIDQSASICASHFLLLPLTPSIRPLLTLLLPLLLLKTNPPQVGLSPPPPASSPLLTVCLLRD